MMIGHHDRRARSRPWATGPAVSALIVVCGFVACGKKGPPLPPLVRVPGPPADFTAERRGARAPSKRSDPRRPTGNPRENNQPAATRAPQPLGAPPRTGPSAVYVAVGINPKGRRGPLTRRVPIPLVPPPQPPGAPQVR